MTVYGKGVILVAAENTPGNLQRIKDYMVENGIDQECVKIMRFGANLENLKLVVKTEVTLGEGRDECIQGVSAGPVAIGLPAVPQ